MDTSITTKVRQQPSYCICRYYIGFVTEIHGFDSRQVKDLLLELGLLGAVSLVTYVAEVARYLLKDQSDFAIHNLSLSRDIAGFASCRTSRLDRSQILAMIISL
uniref:Uncharacterized protein n=1 Tax=Cacopsylla melanoneura TaxID=428564 RepID=A0A8D8Z5S9_9HEMI